MPLTTCAVSCKFRDAAGQPLPGAKVTATLSQLEVEADEGVVIPSTLVALTDENGECVLDLFPNAIGQASSRYTIRLHGKGESRTLYAVVPDALTADLEDILVDRDFDTPPMVAAGPPGPPGISTDQAALIGKAVASAGLRLAIIGASTEERAHPRWNVQAANYQRVSGTATVTFDYSLSDQRFLAGQRVRLACANRTDVEGEFAVLTCSVIAGVSTTITYADARADVAGGTLGSAATVQDLGSWTVSAGWPMHLNMALGGRLDVEVIATGGTNVVTGWGAARVAELEAAGPFDVVLIGTGILGNAIKGYGAGPQATFDALCTLIEAIRDMQDWAPRLVLVEELPATRDVYPTDAVYTAGLRLNRRMWAELPRAYPFVRVVPGADVMVQGWSAPDEDPSSEVLYGWPDANMLASDGIHPAYAWSWVRGAAIAEYIAAFTSDWPVPQMGMLPDTRGVNNATDADGGKNGNLIPGLWGKVAATQVTMSNPGCSGVGPAGSSMGFNPTGRGSSTAVGALVPAFSGGTDWQIAINGAGSTQGYTFTAEHAPAALLSALNDASAQGHWIDLWLPLSLNVPDSLIVWVTVELVATAGGQEYRLAAPQANAGQFSQGALGRAMDAGYSGLLRPPRFFLPVATYTAAAFRVTVKEIPGGTPSGAVALVWGPGQRLQIVG